MAPHDTERQRSAITRFWVVSLVFWPAVVGTIMASGSWLLGLVVGTTLTLASLALTWRVTFGDWACLSVGRKKGRR